MKAVLSMGWSLITFRAGPEALPYLPRLVLPLLMFNLAISLVVQSLAGGDSEQPVLQLSAMALVAEAVWVWWLLQRRGWQNRWVQTYSALVLIDSLITLLAAPLSLLLMQGGSALTGLVAVVQIVMTLWSLSVRGFIYQQAMDVSRWRGILLALTPLFMVMLLTIQFFPELLPTPPQGK